jgi:hypothetical protein
MANEVAIILVVGVAAVGIAYFANMLCQPSGGVICWPPSAVSALPEAVAEIEPETGEVPEATRNFPQQFTEAISKTIGGTPAQTGLLPPVAAPKGSVADILKTAGLNKLGGVPPWKRGTAAPGTSLAQRCAASPKCKAFVGSLGTCEACLKANASSFAEAESYYVRVA